MKPAARVQAAADILDRIAARAAPAERTLSADLRGRRYAGAKDRRALGDRVFAILRARARLDWLWARATGAATGVATGANLDAAAERAGANATSGRHRVLAALVVLEGQSPDAVAALHDGSAHAPPPLTPEEAGAVTALARGAVTLAEAPRWVHLETPPWLLPAFDAAFGDEAAAELGALTRPAAVDLRVNTLKAGSRAAVQAELAAEGVASVATPLSPLGLRLTERQGVTGTAAYREGRIELQDEGSQLAAAAVGAEPGMAVCDLCAGAGGKTLALAAQLAGRGHLVAADRDAARLARAEPRLTRAGAEGLVARHVVHDAGAAGDLGLTAARPGGFDRVLPGGFDRVLVDAPCSGTGTWRRQPDARWRLTRADLRAYQEQQAALLMAGARLVRPGGWLVYATCSLLPAENEARIAPFLTATPGFKLHRESPAGTRRLSPARHGTDGFYVAVLQRIA